MTTRNARSGDLDLARALMQKERLRMMRLLQGGSKNISEIALETKLDRATVSYHLAVLERGGLVASEYRMLKAPLSKGKIGRYYQVDKGNLRRAFEALETLRDEVERPSA